MDWRDVGGTSSNYRFIDSEFKRVPEGIDVDMFFGGGTDSYLRLAAQNLLSPYKLPTAQLKQIPANVSRYSGLRCRISVVWRGVIQFRHHVQRRVAHHARAP